MIGVPLPLAGCRAGGGGSGGGGCRAGDGGVSVPDEEVKLSAVVTQER